MFRQQFPHSLSIPQRCFDYGDLDYVEFESEDGIVDTPWHHYSALQRMNEPASFCLSFQGQQTAINPDDIRGRIITREQIPAVFCCPETEVCLLQHQVHGNQGIVAQSENLLHLLPSLRHESDFLITNRPNVVIGVLTADCLPILLVDPVKQVVSAIHAGWRGSIQRITEKALNAMVATYGCSPSSIEAYFGPSARSCCYEVSPEFLINLSEFSFWQQAVVQRNGKIYFDGALFNKALLIECGIAKKQIHLQEATCTICSERFCSYRRNPASPLRQLSTICIHRLK